MRGHREARLTVERASAGRSATVDDPGIFEPDRSFAVRRNDFAIAPGKALFSDMPTLNVYLP